MRTLNVYKNMNESPNEIINTMVIDCIKDIYDKYTLSKTGLKRLKDERIRYNFSYKVFNVLYDYLTNENRTITQTESNQIKSQCLKSAYLSMIENLDQYILFDTELEFVIDLMRNCKYNDAKTKRNITTVYNNLMRELHNYGMDYITIREFITIITYYTGMTIKELVNLPVYKIYQKIINQVFPYFSIRGIRGNNAVIFTSIVYNILNIIYGYNVYNINSKNDVLTNRNIYRIRKTVKLESIQNNGIFDTLYDNDKFFDIIIGQCCIL